MKRFACLGLLALLPAAFAEMPALKIPPGGQELLASNAVEKAKFNGAAYGSGRRVEFADAPESAGWRIVVTNVGTREWSANLNVDVDGTIKSGETVLLAFYARGTTAEGTESGGGLVVEQKVSPDFLKLGVGAFKAGTNWTPVYVPFMAGVESISNKTAISFQVAGRRQTLELAGIRLINYGREVPLASMPRPYVHYPGREPDAPWRKEALARIESNRVTDFAFQVVDANGKPVEGAQVHAILKRQAFNFGTAIKAQFLMGPDARAPGYRKAVEENFSCVVFENDLKPFGWEGGKATNNRAYRREWLDQSIAWLQERDFTIRGHYLMLGVWEAWSEELRNQPDAIRERILRHMREVTEGVGHGITEWDVLNHPAGWIAPRKTIDLVVGENFYADMIKEARKLTKAPLFVNEDQVFRPGRQQEDYYQIITNLIARGAKPDGIGNQAHFHASFLPSPEDMLRNSDRFAALVPNLCLTEFDVLTNGDEELQADWLRDCLIMAYSHPAYTGFVLWVFWEGTGYKPECALWRRDWSEKPNAKAWREWVCGQWRTDAKGTTDAAGRWTTRGHAGLYEIAIEKDGRRVVAKQSLSRSQPTAMVTWKPGP